MRSRITGRLVGLVVLLGVLVGVTGVAQAAPVVPPDTTVGYLVYDRGTQRVVAALDEHRRFRSASLVKILIALDLLQSRGSVPEGPDPDRGLLEAMLRSSDDDAASALWVRGGWSAIVDRMVPLVGLVDTVPPVDRRYWGYTSTSAADVVATWNFLLDRAPAAYRDFLVGTLERSTRCAADGFDQSFGLPRAVGGPKAVKQGWSGYSARPAGPPCVEGARDVAPTPESLDAAAEAPRADAEADPRRLAAPDVDLSGHAMHTSGVVDGWSRVIAVLTLAPGTRSFDESAAIITDLARTLHDEAVRPPPVAARDVSGRTGR